MEDRVDRCWRRMMSAWARRWKVIRRDPLERRQAALCLCEAIKCRERSLQTAK